MITIATHFLFPLTISICLLYISEKVKIKINNKSLNKVITLIALIIPAIVAASRKIIEVGDSTLYGEFIFNCALENDWKYYFNFLHNNYYSFETGYLLLTYIISRITSNYHILFFIISFINVCIIYDGLKKLEKHIKLDKWMGMLVFYLLFFGETLNIIRQSLGLAIIFWGMHYIYEKKQYKFLLTVFIASLFHISCILGAVLYYVYYLIKKSKNKKILVYLIAFISLFVVIFYSKIFNLLQLLNILPSKFFSLYYLNDIPFSPFAIVTKGPVIIIFWIFLLIKGKSLDDEDGWFYFLLLALDIIISQLAGGNEYLYRMALIFAYNKIIFFSTNYNKKIRVLLIIYSILYFIMEYIYLGALPVQTFK